VCSCDEKIALETEIIMMPLEITFFGVMCVCITSHSDSFLHILKHRFLKIIRRVFTYIEIKIRLNFLIIKLFKFALKIQLHRE
jgi:hypothetical protein